MNEQGKEARRAYKREWARRNPEKTREYQRNYWERRAAAAEERQQAEQLAPQLQDACGTDETQS